MKRFDFDLGFVIFCLGFFIFGAGGGLIMKINEGSITAPLWLVPTLWVLGVALMVFAEREAIVILYSRRLGFYHRARERTVNFKWLRKKQISLRGIIGTLGFLIWMSRPYMDYSSPLFDILSEALGMALMLYFALSLATSRTPKL